MGPESEVGGRVQDLGEFKALCEEHKDRALPVERTSGGQLSSVDGTSTRAIVLDGPYHSGKRLRQTGFRAFLLWPGCW